MEKYEPTMPMDMDGNVGEPQVGKGTGKNSVGKARLYALAIVVLLHTTNTTQQFLLIGVISGMANELEFGARKCVVTNETAVDILVERSGRNITGAVFCAEDGRCDKNASDFTPSACGWEYTGLGTLYDILAGPVYLIIQGIATVPMTIVAQMFTLNHRAAISVFAILWSLTTLGTSFVQEYWTVAVLRFMFGLFSGPYFPFVASYITQLFLPENLSMALGVLYMGGVTGYAISYLFLIANDELGWRACYLITGCIGVFLGFAALTMTNPKRDRDNKDVSWHSWSHQLKYLRLVPWSILLPILIAVASRSAFTNVNSYNINNFFMEYYPEFRSERYMTLVTVLAGYPGCIGGGYLGDFVKRKYDTAGRLWMATGMSAVLVFTFSGLYYVAPPASLIFYILGIFIADSFFTLVLSATSDLVPTSCKTIVFSLYYMFGNTIGGAVNPLVTPIQSVTELRVSLIILSEGMLAISAGTLTMASFQCLVRQRRLVQERTQDRTQISAQPDETTPLLSDGGKDTTTT